ncbi:unnamed protein product [Heligmosomoides polygyrus]|uniref:Reverse transcriptase domain-containing protein n=1 Tax=Heligmosomoides polygyrus TaxID=6339 RepID=A0A3P8CL32_HELPZ|nr:unnamed protein product [Heligmosomoides polygyrus]
MHYLRFADDIVLITPRIGQAERILADFDRVCGNAGLQLNFTRTLFIRKGRVVDALFSLNRTKIFERSSCVSLGSEVDMLMHLTGTKIGCNEGGCGACTVMISEISLTTNEIRHFSANSCLMPVCAVFGKAVTTVEGLGSVVSKKLHPVQERLAMLGFVIEALNPDGFWYQGCGFCTPGFVMAMYALLRNKPTPTEADIDEALQGNLCRCTGYRPVLEAFYSFAVKENGDVKVTESNGCGMGDKCCKVTKAGLSSGEKLKLTDLSRMAAYDPSQELIFPPELRVLELHVVRLDKDGAYLGTGLSLTEVDHNLKKYMKRLPGWVLEENERFLTEEQCGVFRAVHDVMHWFAGKHVRNVAVVLESDERGVRCPAIDEKFFIAYRRAAIEADEVVKAIIVPLTKKNQFFRVYKQAQRREDDIAIVTGAFNVSIDPSTLTVEDIRIAFGGMAPTTKLALNTMEQLKGKYAFHIHLKIVRGA